MVNLVQLILPTPPSINRYWRTTRAGKVYITESGREYRESTALAARIRMGDRPPFGGPVAVTIEWRRARRAGDLDNRAKVVLDALQGYIYGNDSQIVSLNMIRRDSKEDAGVTVTVREVDTPT